MSVKKQAPLIGLGVFALTILLFYLSYEYVFFVNLFSENVVGLIIWSFFIAVAFSLFSFLEKKVALMIMLLTYVSAFITLFIIFSDTDNTFNNITGLLMFIIIIIGGFVVSLIMEIILWFFIKRKNS